MTRFEWSLLGAMVLACAESAADDSAYNRGVDAYKKQDYAEALTQWSASVAKGNIDAMNNLGYLFYYGHGTDRAPQDAVQLWRVAAFAGQSEAQWHLATAYETGVGVEADAAKAYAWYRCSIETAGAKLQGDKGDAEALILKDAKQSLAKLRLRLSADDLNRGQGLAADYIRRYAKAAP
jgi:TPR repeat protein